MSDFHLPDGYIQRQKAVYFDDSPFSTSEMIHQPEVYEVADYFLRTASRSTIIDVGCGNGRKLRAVNARNCSPR